MAAAATTPVACHFDRRSFAGARHGNPRDAARDDLIRWCRLHDLPVPAEVIAQRPRP